MPRKKAPRTDANPINKETYQKDKIHALKALLERSNRLEQIRLRSLQAQEECLLILAIEIQELKQLHGGSWRDFGEEFFGAVDYSTLHKLANRNIYLKEQSYLRITEAINSLRVRKGLTLISFPNWQGI